MFPATNNEPLIPRDPIEPIGNWETDSRHIRPSKTTNHEFAGNFHVQGISNIGENSIHVVANIQYDS